MSDIPIALFHSTGISDYFLDYFLPLVPHCLVTENLYILLCFSLPVNMISFPVYMKLMFTWFSFLWHFKSFFSALNNLILLLCTLCYDFRQLRQSSTVIVSKVRSQMSLEECKSWTCIVLLGLRAKVQLERLSIKD